MQLLIFYMHTLTFFLWLILSLFHLINFVHWGHNFIPKFVIRQMTSAIKFCWKSTFFYSLNQFVPNNPSITRIVFVPIFSLFSNLWYILTDQAWYNIASIFWLKNTIFLTLLFMQDKEEIRQNGGDRFVGKVHFLSVVKYISMVL